MMRSVRVFSLILACLWAGLALASANCDPLTQYYETYGNMGLPDVMGNVNIVDEMGKRSAGPTWGWDEITVYPGYPINVSSWSHEGGIYYDVDADGELEIIYYIGQTVRVLNSDGTSVAGWPQSTYHYTSGAPALGDIDGDGDDEIVVGMNYTMTTGGVDAFELDGTRVSGFPLNNHGYVSRSPTLADLDDDGAMEIIVNKRMWPLGEWWVYSGDGTVYPGWPQPIDHVPSSSSAVGDVNGDGIPEIIGESYDALYVWDVDGNVLPGWPFYMPYSAVNSYSAPILADLDSDGLNEIVFGTHTLTGSGYVFVMNGDGTQMPGWPKQVGSWIYGPPSIGYVDGDDILDIVIGDQTLSPTPMNFIYGWNANGQTLDNFPIGPVWAINNQVALVDLDSDGMVEMIIDDNTMLTATYEGKYLAYNHDGTPVEGWPLIVTGCTIFHMPCLMDIDSDGFLDMSGEGSYASEGWTNIFLWYTDYVYDPDAVIVPCFQYNLQHDGVPVFEFAPPDLAVTLTPINPPIVIPAGGGSFDFTGEIENVGTSTAVFDVWIEADLPTGGTVGPLILREDISLGAGLLLSRDLTQDVPDFAPAGLYTYRLEVGSYPATVYASDEFTFFKDSVDADASVSSWTLYGWENQETVMAISETPQAFRLVGNYPNPFNPTTTISYQLSTISQVNLMVYDVSGRKVAELVNGRRNAGYHEVTFDASGLHSGLYLYRLSASDFSAVGKMVLMK